MKYIFLFTISALFFSCSTDDDELIKHATIKLNFTQNWDKTPINTDDLSRTKFTNKLGTKLIIDDLYYIISNVIFTDGAGISTVFKTHYLVNLKDSKSLTAVLPEKISEGIYTVSVTFGLNKEENSSKNLKGLENFNVSEKLGGGYHFMKMDGTYFNAKKIYVPFNYHTISPFNTATKKTENTSFLVDLGRISIKNDATIELKMNVAQWFKNPKDWDLNELNTYLTKSYDTQKMMFENGKKGVFSLGTVSQ